MDHGLQVQQQLVLRQESEREHARDALVLRQNQYQLQDTHLTDHIQLQKKQHVQRLEQRKADVQSVVQLFQRLQSLNWVMIIVHGR